MAEFCGECFKDVEGDHSDKKLVMSSETDLCEGCGKYRHVVVRVQNKGFLSGIIEFVKKFGL